MIKAAQALEAVRTDSTDWQDRVRDQLDQGTNFFLILPDEPEAAKRFCAVFDLEEDCVNNPMSRSDFLLLSPHMDEKGAKPAGGNVCKGLRRQISRQEGGRVPRRRGKRGDGKSGRICSKLRGECGIKPL